LFQKAIAAAPEAALPGYMIGGLSWFSIPFCLATTFGLAARALEHTPAWPTYPNPMTADQIAQGLPFPFAVQALMGMFAP
jgi:urea-proton symporter